MKEKAERRAFDFELRSSNEQVESRIAVGHAAVFDQTANIGGLFNERITRGAFRSVIDDPDVMALFNHDENLVLGRTGSGTTRLAEDETGLATEIDLPDTQFSRDLQVLMKRGDIRKMSFTFVSDRDSESWDTRTNTRTINVFKKLYDVSIVTFPAYKGTSAAMRSAQDVFDSRLVVEVERLPVLAARKRLVNILEEKYENSGS